MELALDWSVKKKHYDDDFKHVLPHNFSYYYEMQFIFASQQFFLP